MLKLKKSDRQTIGNISYIKESAVLDYIADKSRRGGKIDHSKKITVAVFVLTAICVFADYILTALGLEVYHAVTQTILGIFAAVVTGYFGKSLGEKHSRNKHGVDENGVPHESY